MKRMLQLWIFMVVLVGLATVSFAASECPVCNAAGSDNYLAKTGGQLTRGVANIGLGWVELVNQPVKEVKGGGNLLVGLGKGVGHTCLRVVQGAGEIITSPMPRAKGGKYAQIADSCPLDVVGITERPAKKESK